MDEQGKCFLEMEPIPGKDAVKTVEVTPKDSEYSVSLADNAEARFERIDSNFERSSSVGKMLLNSIACYRELVCERKSQSMQQTSLLSYFKNSLQPPNLQQPSP